MSYKPLKVALMEVCGVGHSLEAMRLPFNNRGKTPTMELAGKLIKAGDDHGKFIRGCIAYIKVEMQVGFMIDLETYRAGIECLSTSSTMHNELKGMSGVKLAELKQELMVDKVYTRIMTVSYQALRNIYKARRKHRHPDFTIFCDFIEEMPYFSELIMPELGNE